MGNPIPLATGIARSSADDVLSKVRQASIRAYHGSPHNFDRFDASKIGSGEGAQAYGYGLYFSSAEELGQRYRDNLRWRGQDASNLPTRAAMWVQRHGSPELAIAALQSDIDKSLLGKNSWSSRLNRGAIDYLQSGQALPSLPSGHMYEVDLGVPKEALLNYDRPFARPSGAVAAAVLRDFDPSSISPDVLRALQDGSWRLDATAYPSPYEMAALKINRMAGRPAGAKALLEAGIPGVQYRDPSSSSAGQGVSNYVMFPGTEDSITILRKYGLLPPLAAASMQGEE